MSRIADAAQKKALCALVGGLIEQGEASPEQVAELLTKFA